MPIERAPANFELVQEGNLWVATHVETEIASQGETPNEAVSRAEEAAQLHGSSHPVGDEAHQREMLVRFDIDPDEVADSIDTPF